MQRGGCDDVVAEGWYGSPARIAPSGVAPSTYETTCESEMRALHRVFIQSLKYSRKRKSFHFIRSPYHMRYLWHFLDRPSGKKFSIFPEHDIIYSLFMQNSALLLLRINGHSKFYLRDSLARIVCGNGAETLEWCSFCLRKLKIVKKGQQRSWFFYVIHVVSGRHCI